MSHDEERPEKGFEHRFFQQKLPHVYSQASPQAVILCLFVVAVVFIPIGAATIIASDSIFEVDYRYDAVHKCTYAENQQLENFTANGTTVSMGCKTNVNFTLDKTISPPIYIYYRLKGFHQNYRQYAQSIYEPQLAGHSFTREDLGSCDDFQGPDAERAYAPCGVVAWSMFNDTISLYSVNDTAAAATTPSSLSSLAVPICKGGAFNTTTNEPTETTGCVKKGIAFQQDVEYRFQGGVKSSDPVVTSSGGPGDVYAQNGWYANETGHKLPTITDEDFMTWARIATLPDFRKLYRKINVELPRGKYVWSIDERFDTTSIDAEKHVVLATRNWIGGKNHVLGALYLTMGSVSLLLAFGFIGMYIARNKE